MANQDSRKHAASRRDFLKSAAVVGASVGISSSVYNSIQAEPTTTLPFPRIKKTR